MRSTLAMAAIALCACKGVVVTAFPDTFVGVGVELTIRDNCPVVVHSFAGGSAAEAGVIAEDRIVAINDAPTEGLALPDLVLKLRGETGTAVNVTLIRNGRTVQAQLVRHAIEKQGDGYVARTK